MLKIRRGTLEGNYRLIVFQSELVECKCDATLTSLVVSNQPTMACSKLLSETISGNYGSSGGRKEKHKSLIN